jgi:outer membrane immunogenic protein
MKRFVFAAMLFVAAGSHAFAADLPSPPMQPAYAPAAVALAYNWTGFYVGVNGGYGWGNQDPFNIVTNRFDSFAGCQCAYRTKLAV